MKLKFFACLLIPLFFAACDSPTGGSGNAPVSTVNWELGQDNFIKFSTNDSKYYQYSFSASYENRNADDIYQAELKKMSGSLNYVYGMMFALQDFDNYYRVDITTSKFYRILKRSGGADEVLKDFEITDLLYSGLNKINTIKAITSAAGFTVFFNGHEVFNSDDTSIAGEKIGYYASVGKESDEGFPNTPVDLRFRQKLD